MKIKLFGSKDISEFVNMCCSFMEEIDVKKGRYIIDGKSILGVSSLDGSEVMCEIHTENKAIKDNFYYKLRKWAV